MYSILVAVITPVFSVTWWSFRNHSWCTHASQRLQLLWRLRVYGVDKSIMLLFYRSVIESMICYAFTVWFGNLTVKKKKWLGDGKIIDIVPLTSLQEIFERSVKKQSFEMIGDPRHILHKEHELMPSGRRYRVPTCKLNRYKFSFIPLSTALLNTRK